MTISQIMSKRKPHNNNSGYIAERIFKPSGSHIVIYRAAEQGLDVTPDKYAVVCSTHGTMVGNSSIPKARVDMKYPEFCEYCMKMI
jgi:hypothetical protein